MSSATKLLLIMLSCVICLLIIAFVPEKKKAPFSQPTPFDISISKQRPLPIPYQDGKRTDFGP